MSGACSKRAVAARAGCMLACVGPACISAACADTQVTCGAGEMRYSGRPPRELFAQDETCREDCFSLPEGACGASCPDIAIYGTGAIVDGRTLILADGESPGGDRTLAFSFGYVDEAGGTAPDNWSVMIGGAQSYLADQVNSTARFVVTAGVYAAESNSTLGAEYAAVTANPGRLEVRRADIDRIAGRFFLTFNSATGQPNAQLNGCFDLSVAPADASGVQRLGL